jgi:hypothetical protein
MRWASLGRVWDKNKKQCTDCLASTQNAVALAVLVARQIDINPPCKRVIAAGSGATSVPQSHVDINRAYKLLSAVRSKSNNDSPPHLFAQQVDIIPCCNARKQIVIL